MLIKPVQHLIQQQEIQLGCQQQELFLQQQLIQQQ